MLISCIQLNFKETLKSTHYKVRKRKEIVKNCRNLAQILLLALNSQKGIQGIFCVWLLMDMTAFPGPIFKSRTIFGNDFSSSFQIWGQNFKFQMFRVRKSWKTFLSRRLICCVRLLMDMTAFPGPIFKSRTIFGNYFPSCFQIWGLNFKFLTFRVCKSWKTLLFRRLINVCSYWWIWLLFQVWFSKVGPFSEVIFQANFRFAVEISNFQLLGHVKAEKLSFLEG